MKDGENKRVAKWKEWNRQQTKVNNALIQRNIYLEEENKKYLILVDYVLENTFQSEFFGDAKKLREMALGVENGKDSTIQ